ncbi:hypothetical protein OCU04_008529 [Sclerotinia nivalis]|uniref:ATP-dependent DNA helicase n=1 Tax=Sclerotinia nivalis TaxID=352851 RepID=A0A9X0AI83_9HELO|nr:hypothetical protein OCU04_008529 [Sclerotinia nivalis]
MEASRVVFARYWGVKITAWNPAPSSPPDMRNPGSLAPGSVANTADQLAAFVNRFQQHNVCRPNYCLRTRNGTDAGPTCRFFYPRPLFPAPIVTRDINHKGWLFSPARNQSSFNQCSPVITMGWMANTDIQPPTRLAAVLSYIGKYVSKPEKSSASYMLNQLIGERDWSAQEVSHILLRLPVQHCSREVITCDCRPEKAQPDLLVLESGEISAQRSVLRRYRDRVTDTGGANAAVKHVSLFDWLRLWDWKIWRPRPRAPARAINYYPRYLNDPQSDTYSKYCRVKLMLHHPFADWDDLLSVDNQLYSSFPDAFRACNHSHSHPDDFYTDPEADSSDADDDSADDGEDEQDEQDEYPLADFEAFARRRPGNDFTEMDFFARLGGRDVDQNYDWSSHIGRYEIYPEIWDHVKADNPIEQLVHTSSSAVQLNAEQRKLYDTVVNQYIQELDLFEPVPRQLLLNVDSVAGSGKTFTLLKICARLQDLAQEAGRENPVFRAAPTGIAVYNP